MTFTSVNTKLIATSIQNVYKAFTDKEILEYWLSPNCMEGKIHQFELKEGGGYDMSLYYTNSKHDGKTTEHEDRFTVTFEELKPYSKIRQTIRFQTNKGEFKKDMTMDITIEPFETNSAKVTILFTDIPIGIDPRDNEEGTNQSLEKLAAYFKNH